MENYIVTQQQSVTASSVLSHHVKFSSPFCTLFKDRLSCHDKPILGPDKKSDSRRPYRCLGLLPSAPQLAASQIPWICSTPHLGRCFLTSPRAENSSEFKSRQVLQIRSISVRRGGFMKDRRDISHQKEGHCNTEIPCTA